MAGRGKKCPHIISISDFNQADVEKAKEVSIVELSLLVLGFVSKYCYMSRNPNLILLVTIGV
jgi:ABC-type iron transport system FetAB permease component